MFKHLFIFFVSICAALSADATICPAKVFICGAAKNIECKVPNLTKNLEALKQRFEDYKVILYENNSTDNTASLLTDWAANDDKVIFISETLPEAGMERTERIARARNALLNKVREINNPEYSYLIMVDLDFLCDWPIDAIIESVNAPFEWDCISANGKMEIGNGRGNMYWDRYAYRSREYPFGPEMLGEDYFWNRLFYTPGVNMLFNLEGKDYVPTYSAFGGLAIYKTSALINANYSGTVTDDLAKYFAQIFAALPKEDYNRQEYLHMIGMDINTDSSLVPIQFRQRYTCEHVPLHASMALQGHGKFFINPQMLLQYPTY